MKKREENIQPQMKKAQISPSFPLESQASPMFFKLFKLQCALEMSQFVFFRLPLKISNFPFLYAEKRVKTRSCELCSPVARHLTSHWRDYRDGTPVACHLACDDAVARQLACRWQAAFDFKF